MRLRMEREETAYEEAHGTSDVRAFCSGYCFTLMNHFKGAYNDKWLLTSVLPFGFAEPALREYRGCRRKLLQ